MRVCGSLVVWWALATVACCGDGWKNAVKVSGDWASAAGERQGRTRAAAKSCGGGGGGGDVSSVVLEQWYRHAQLVFTANVDHIDRVAGALNVTLRRVIRSSVQMPFRYHFILSYLILSYLILSYLISSYLMLSYVNLSYVVLCYVILRCLMLSYVSYVTLRCLMWSYVSYVTLCCLMLSYVVVCDLMLSYVILCYPYVILC